MSDRIKDISGRILNKNDKVFILDIKDPSLDITHIVSSLPMGRIITAQDENNVFIDIGGAIYKYNANQLSRIDTSEEVDDIIIHVSHDVEEIQLLKESDILNNMLK